MSQRIASLISLLENYNYVKQFSLFMSFRNHNGKGTKMSQRIASLVSLPEN